ncbi:ATP synthase subunit delta [Candidatus Hartigia pinicola]|nr:ATP synthase subunit delta [Candidatus Hartigia pinicola]
MPEIATVARPYSKAIFNFSLENQSFEKIKHMLMFTSKVICNKHFSHLLSYHIVPEKIATILISICGDKIDEHMRNFIRIMAQNKRLGILPEVLKQFTKLHKKLELIIEVDMISSTKLNKQQLKKISALMEKHLSYKVKMNYKIDKSIIAGVIIRAEDLVIDGSVRGRLARLTDFLES